MQATDWEFKNRALIFGMVLGLSFPLYIVDPQNATAAISNWLGATLYRDPDRIVRWLFLCAAVWLAAAAVIRTWASAYLQATVVYAGDVKAESLVADGPYRRVRNPVYFANVLLAFGMGAKMSRVGCVFAVAAGICLVGQQTGMVVADMENDRPSLEQGEIALFIGRNLSERMKHEMRGFLHLTERKKTNLVRLAHFFERPAHAQVTRQSFAAIGRFCKRGNGRCQALHFDQLLRFGMPLTGGP